MSRLLFAPQAQADLEDIWNFTVARWSQAQAAKYLREIDLACRELAAGSRLSTGIDDIRAGYRKARVQSHVVFFRVDEGTGETIVVRILHQRMDVTKHLQKDD